MRTMITIFFLSAALSCRAAPPFLPPAKPVRHLIVFYDISRSVAEDEEKAAEDYVKAIFNVVPGGTDLEFIAICANTDGAPQMSWTVKSTGIALRSIRQGTATRDKKRDEVLANMHALRGTAAANSHYSSCVSPALRRVQSLVSTPEEASSTDILFISDMIEECEDSVLPKPTSILDDHFHDALALVDEKSTLLELPAGLHVYVFRPRAKSTTLPSPHHPSAAQLKSFWEKLFSRCGIRKEQLKWDADIDQYLRALAS